MELKDLLSISGKPGLYKMVAQNKTSLIVESLIDGKKMPVYSANKISALEDISIYTYEEDIPLASVFQKIWDKENGGKAIDHKSQGGELKSYMTEVLPDYDEDRVYTSDLKKIFNWYNNLHENNLLISKDSSESEETSEEDSGSED